MSNPFWGSISVGGADQHAALVVVELPRFFHLRPDPAQRWHYLSDLETSREVDRFFNHGSSYDDQKKPSFVLRVLMTARWEKGTRHLDIIEAIRTLLPPLVAHDSEDVSLFVETTAAGTPLLDNFVKANLVHRVIGLDVTGEREAGPTSGKWERLRLKVPKHFLITATKDALEEGRLVWSERLEHRKVMEQELQNYTPKPSAINPDLYDTTRRQYDDLVLAMAMSTWYLLHYAYLGPIMLWGEDE